MLFLYVLAYTYLRIWRIGAPHLFSYDGVMQEQEVPERKMDVYVLTQGS